MKREYISSSPAQTKKLGEKFAKEVLRKKPRNKALVFGLSGELGGGKTTFLQGFAKGLGIKEKILSPTFIIMKKFEIRNPKSETNSKFKSNPPGSPLRVQQNSKFYLYHIDCYRIQKPKELINLSFKEIISEPKNIVAIEWAGYVQKIMPKDSIWIKFDFIDEKKRKITFRNFMLK